MDENKTFQDSMKEFWARYPVIAQHPSREDFRLIKHPNGVAVIDGSSGGSIALAIERIASEEGASEAGAVAEWIVFALNKTA